AGAPRAALWQSLDAIPFRGQRLRLRGKLRVAKHGRGRLWMRVDRGDKTGFTDTMWDRPVVTEGWTFAEIVGSVDSDATRIVFGVMMTGGGVVWYDDLEIAVGDPNGAWNPVAINDAGFEAADLPGNWNTGTGTPSESSLTGWNVSLDPDNPASGH